MTNERIRQIRQAATMRAPSGEYLAEIRVDRDELIELCDLALKAADPTKADHDE